MAINYERAKAQFEAAFPGTVKELIAGTGWHRTTVERWLARYRQATPRQSHITDWRAPATTGPFVPVHSLGDGPDAPCILQPLSKTALWYRRVKKHGRAHLRRKQRTSEWLRKAREGKKPLLETLFFAGKKE